MNKTQTNWLIVSIVILSATVMTLVGVFVIQPAITNDSNETPVPTALFIYEDGASNIGGGQYQFNVDVKVTFGSLTLDAVTVAPTLTITVVNATSHTMIGYNIDEATVTVLIRGAFTPGTDYTFTFAFSSGEDSIAEDITIQA